jgi:hypothetical protein
MARINELSEASDLQISPARHGPASHFNPEVTMTVQFTAPASSRQASCLDTCAAAYVNDA